MKFLLIGIDPDIEASGIAVKNIETKALELYTKGFFDTVKFLIRNRDSIKEVVVEASWLISKSSWHSSQSKETAARIGKDVGRNQATGMCLVDMLKGLGIPVREQKPLKLRWGKDGKSKISHAEIQKIVDFRKAQINVKRTNQEMRDALLLIL